MRGDDQRWRLQHELMRTDPVTGIDKHVLSLLAPDVPVSSHEVWTADGARLSYKRFGRAPQTILFCNGLGGTYRTFAEVIARLLPTWQVLVFDYRGLFDSGEPPDRARLTLPDHARDLFTVLDDAGVGQARLFGWSMGVQVCLEAWRQQPARIQAMIFASGVDGRILDSVLDVPLASRLAPGFVRAMRDYGGLVTGALGRTVQLGPVKRMAQALHLVGRNADTTMEHAAMLLSSDPAVYWRIVENLQDHDAADVLPTINVPVLILHGDRDVLTPVRKGLDLRSRIPNSEIWVFDGCTHAVVLEYPERVARHTREFLMRRVGAPG